jgi:hypothetical protein
VCVCACVQEESGCMARTLDMHAPPMRAHHLTPIDEMWSSFSGAFTDEQPGRRCRCRPRYTQRPPLRSAAASSAPELSSASSL